MLTLNSVSHSHSHVSLLIRTNEPRALQVTPAMSFSDSRLPADLISACCGSFSAPTCIQAQCWPVLLANRDLVGLAETGSGKTLAFTLPGIKKTLDGSGGKTKQQLKESPVCLVIAPTRELALQSAKVVEDSCIGAGLTSTCLYGGVPKMAQRDILRKGVSFIVATPGRLKDLVEEQVSLMTTTFTTTTTDTDHRPTGQHHHHHHQPPPPPTTTTTTTSR